MDLVEDKELIIEKIDSYLQKQSVSGWKLWNLVKMLLDDGMTFDDVGEDLLALGDLYDNRLTKFYEQNQENFSPEESSKIQLVQQSISKLSTAPQLLSLVKENIYRKKYIQSLKDIAINNQESMNTPPFHTLSSLSKVDTIALKYGKDEILDLDSSNLPHSAKPFMKEIKSDMNIKLKPAMTLVERALLMKVSKCKNKDDYTKILRSLYKQKSLSENCKYIRFAIASALELWDKKALLNCSDKGEDWFRMHVYCGIWDKLYVGNDKFTTKRSECESNIIKALNHFNKVNPTQKIDFILRDINNKDDFVSVEEKSTNDKVKDDVIKGKKLQKLMLVLWSKYIQSKAIQELEAITCQWSGLKFTMYGSRLLPSNFVLQYKKGSVQMPVDETHGAQFAQLLMVMISLNRQVLLNYEKFNIMLEYKLGKHVANLELEDSDTEENDPDSHHTQDSSADKGLIKKVHSATFEADVKTYEDWEELIMEKVAKKQKLN